MQEWLGQAWLQSLGNPQRAVQDTRETEDGVKTLSAGPHKSRVASGGYPRRTREKRAGRPDGLQRTQHIAYDHCNGVERLSRTSSEGGDPGQGE